MQVEPKVNISVIVRSFEVLHKDWVDCEIIGPQAIIDFTKTRDFHKVVDDVISMVGSPFVILTLNLVHDYFYVVHIHSHHNDNFYWEHSFKHIFNIVVQVNIMVLGKNNYQHKLNIQL